MGQVDLEQLIEEKFTDMSFWEASFKMIKSKGRDAEKLPRYSRAHFNSLSNAINFSCHTFIIQCNLLMPTILSHSCHPLISAILTLPTDTFTPVTLSYSYLTYSHAKPLAFHQLTHLLIPYLDLFYLPHSRTLA